MKKFKETNVKITEKDINVSKEDVFSKEEVLNVANRKYSILHSNTSELNDPKKQGEYPSEDAQKMLTDLNNKLRASQEMINDLQVKLNKKNDEFNKLKQEFEKISKSNNSNNNVVSNPDDINSNHRLLLIEAVKL